MRPAATAGKTSSGLKIVLVLVGLMAFCGIAAVGGMLYLAHRVKAAVVDKAKEYGVDLPQVTSPHTSATPRRIPKPCDVLSKQEVATLLGEPIERSEVQDQTCFYYGPPGLAATLAKANASRAINSAEAPGAKPNAGEMATAMEQLAETSGPTELTGVKGEVPLLMLGLDPDGKGAMAAMGVANAMFSGIANAAGAPKGTSAFAEISGLGDRAIRSPKLGLHVLKGDLVIGVLPGPLPDADNKSVAVARAVLAKL